MDNKVSFSIKLLDEKKYGNHYKVRIKIPTCDGWIDHVGMNVLDGNQEKFFPLNFVKNEDGYAIFESDIFLNTRASYSYYFSYVINGVKKEYKKKHDADVLIDNEYFKLPVQFHVPDWAKGKMIYHIFVDRFYHEGEELPKLPNRVIHEDWEELPVLGPHPQNGLWNCDFYGGNLKGIIDRLDYIQSLGVDILYLSPIMESSSTHRYDTGNYLEIDPYVGSKKDFIKLCHEAHLRGMKVILDAVFNHTGNDSIYYNEFGHYDSLGAYQSKESPYYSYYKTNENGNFSFWWGNTNLPVCDSSSNSWKEFITGEGGVIDQWFQMGIDGLRLDVADELSDEYIEAIRDAVHRNKKNGFILGEVWENPMKMNRGYISSGRGMDSVMNYSLMDALIRYYKYTDVHKLKNVLSSIIYDYPDDTIQSFMNFTSTHDISRAIDIFASDVFSPYNKWAWDVDNENHQFLKNHKISHEDYLKGKAIYKSYLFALTFLPGNLSIFYGDEVGMEGLGNLLNRSSFPWTRMDTDLLEYFRFLGKIRKEEPFLEKADFRVRELNPNYFMFERILNKDKALITVNRTNQNGHFIVPPEYEGADKVYTLKKSKPSELAPYGAVAIKK